VTSIFPSPYRVVHIARYIDEDQIDPDTGNAAIVADPPVVRKVQSISQFGRRGSSHEVISSEYELRTQTEIHLSVANPEVYAPDDQVLLNAEFTSSGQYVSGTGTAYWVDGNPADSRQGPWPQYLAVFGGVVKLRRIT
jgi:hypothetical protein